MQQKVVGLCGVTVPMGWPPLAGHVPPVTCENVALRLAVVGFPARLVHAPAVDVGLSVATSPVQVLTVVAEYMVTVAEQEPPPGTSQEQPEQARVSEALV